MTSAERSYRLLVTHAAVYAAGYIGIAALADLSDLHNLPAILALCAVLSICVNGAYQLGHAGRAHDLMNSRWRDRCGGSPSGLRPMSWRHQREEVATCLVIDATNGELD